MKKLFRFFPTAATLHIKFFFVFYINCYIFATDKATEVQAEKLLARVREVSCC
jgi:hypothetical protein